jgi:virginiamycin B lyase
VNTSGAGRSVWGSGGAGIVVLVLGLVAASSVYAAEKLRLRSVDVPSAVPRAITVGPDGNLWFTGDNGTFYGWPQQVGGYIGRIDARGRVRVFRLPTPASGPEKIIDGGDGALWFTERDANKIGRISTNGTITEFAVPVPNAQPRGIARGSDGAFYITLFQAGAVARMTPSGQFTIFTAGLSPGGEQLGITRGPDGAVWFTEPRGDRIVRLTPRGDVRAFAVSNVSGPESIARSPDGNLYFTEDDGDRVGRVTPRGLLEEWPVTPGSNPSGITAGRDGAMWFAELEGHRVARVTPSGIITEYPLPRESFPFEVVASPDGRIWVTLGHAGKIVSFVPPLPPVVGVRFVWAYRSAPGGFRFTRLKATGLPRDGRLRLRCRGNGCRARLSRRGASSINLRKRLPTTIRPGTTVDVRVSAPGLTTLVRTWSVTRRKITQRDRCQAPRSSKLRRCPRD